MQNAVALQLDTCLSICSTIETLLLDSLGPNGLHTMLTTSSGQALISGDGHTIVTSLMLSHPIARWMVDHMKSHHGNTGDNAKSFILLLTEILRHILHKEWGSVTALNRYNLTEISQGFGELGSVILPDIVLPELIKHATITDVTEQNKQLVKHTCLNMIRTTFAGKFSKRASNHMSELVCNFVLEYSPELETLDQSIVHLLDNFEEVFLEVTNEPVTSSRVLSGVTVSRDFIYKAVTLNSLSKVKFILAGTSLESYSPDNVSTLNISNASQMQQALNYKLIRTQRLIRHINSLGVNLILSAELVSDATLHECRQAGISVIHMVPEEEIAHIAHITSVRILHGPDDVINEHCIGIADYCESIRMGSGKCVRLGVHTKQLVICGPTKGMCRQWYTAVHNALKCLRMWLDHKQPICSTDQPASIRARQVEDNLASLQEIPQDHCDKQPIDQLQDSPKTATGATSKVHTPDMHSVDPKHLQKLSIIDSDASENKPCTASGTSTKKGLSITGGGAADILISKLLANHSVKPSTSLAAAKACKVVTEAILCIPRTLHSNTSIPKCAKTSFIHVQNQIETELCVKGKLYGVDGKTGKAGDLSVQGVIEPVMAKFLLCSDVVRTVHEMLRIDTVVGVRGSLKEIEQDSD